MKLLIIEKNVERQGDYTRRIKSFDRRDIEMFDLQVSLATELDATDQIVGMDVVILGAGLGEATLNLARKLHTLNPKARMIWFAGESMYSAGFFRQAYAVGIQKVLPTSASNLDLLQELVAILDALRREGSVHEGSLVCFIQAKGGSGSTTLCAALASACESKGKNSLLWDFDVDTADLSRSLSVGAVQSGVFGNWLDGTSELTRESVKLAASAVSDYISVLPPPRESMAESFDLVCHTQGLTLSNRIAELSKATFDAILVDTAGRLGPATGSLISVADHVVLVIDDTVMGLTGLNMFVNFIKPLIQEKNSLVFLVNGTSRASLAIKEVRDSLESIHRFGADAWRLPPIPLDHAGTGWAGSGDTLFTLGSRETRAAFETIAKELGLV